jgi:hypothetical protein
MRSRYAAPETRNGANAVVGALGAGGNVEGGLVGREALWMRPVWVGVGIVGDGVVRFVKMWEIQENAIFVGLPLVFGVKSEYLSGILLLEGKFDSGI